jgi:hypothetical protein
VEEVTGGSRKLHDELVHDLYCSSNIIRALKPLDDKTRNVASTHRGDVLTDW